MTEQPRSRLRILGAGEAPGRNPTGNPTMGDVIAARFHRRDVLKGALAATGATFTSATTRDGWLGMPDNRAVDHRGACGWRPTAAR